MANSKPTRNSCETNVSMKKCSILWTINDYGSFHEKRESAIVSSSFSNVNDELEWLLFVVPPQRSVRNKWVSLELSPVQAGDDLRKYLPISGMMKCSILNADSVETNSKNKEIIITKDTCSFHRPAYIRLSDFVEETYLHNPDNRLLPNDKLTILCEVSYAKNSEVVTTRSQPFSSLELEEDIPVCLKSLRTFFLNPEFSDITLHVNGEDYPAHRNILAARSPVFKAMLTNDMQEKRTSRIEIKDLNKPTFTEMLRYIYFGQPENLNTLVSELLAAADKYDLEQLRNLCEKKLYEKLSPKTAVNTLILADTHHAKTLKNQTLQYMKIHSHDSQMLDDEARKLLMETYPNLLFEILDVFGK